MTGDKSIATLVAEAGKAFSYTHRHPADRHVRVTSDPRGLGALFVHGVRAVEFEREMPADVAEELRTLDPARYPEGNTPLTGESGFGMAFSDLATRTIVPPSIIADSRRILELFSHVSSPLPPEERRYAMSCQSYRKAPPPLGFRDGTAVPWFPHADGMPVRATVVYDLDREQGMKWVPGHMTLEERGLFEEAMVFSANPREVMRKWKIQTSRPGNVVFFKGEGCTDHTHEEKEKFLHFRAPRNQGGLRFFTAFSPWREKEIVPPPRAKGLIKRIFGF